MTVEQLLNTLGIKAKTAFEDGKTVIKTNDSNVYAQLYTVLEKSDATEILPEETIMTKEETKLVYINSDDDNTYILTLNGDLDNDIYSLEIEEQ